MLHVVADIDRIGPGTANVAMMLFHRNTSTVQASRWYRIRSRFVNCLSNDLAYLPRRQPSTMSLILVSIFLIIPSHKQQTRIDLPADAADR